MSIEIHPRELKFSFSRSSGAGGQNVNKVNTKVTMRWNVQESQSISNAVAERFIKKYENRILEDGSIVITSQRFRVQARNIADCVEKLHTMIEKVATPPKKRKPTKPKRSAIEKRLKAKRIQSEKKKRRQEY